MIISVSKPYSTDLSFDTSTGEDKKEIVVITDQPKFSYGELNGRPDVPAILSAHPDPTIGFGMRLNSYSIKTHPEANCTFLVGLNYSSKTSGNDRDNNNKPVNTRNPLMRVPVVDRTNYVVTEQIPFHIKPDGTVDKNTPVQTTAGEPLFLDETRSYESFDVSMNVVRIPKIVRDPAISGDFLNNSPFRIDDEKYPSETLWATDFKLSQWKEENGFSFRVYTFKVLYNPLGWRKRIMNVGFYQLKYIKIGGAGKNTLVPIKIGNPPRFPSNPVPLNKFGEPFTVTDDNGVVHILGADDSSFNVGMNAAEWEENKIIVNTRQHINFKKLIPKI